MLNKVDKVFPKERLLPFIEELGRRATLRRDRAAVGAEAAATSSSSPTTIAGYLPESPPHFPDDQVTDRSEQFQAAEIVREKLTLASAPGAALRPDRRHRAIQGRGRRGLLINAVIWVERSGQKAIVIGNGGEQLKEVGRAARLEMNELFKRPVHLELWVKVKENWSDNETALRQLGYET